MNTVTERPRAKRRLADEYPDRVRPSKLAHAVLTTPNLPRARGWYLNALAAKVAFENDKVCFMTYDNEHHRIGLIALPKLVERFFFQAEDGIRDGTVTGVQTCALPI